MLVPSIDLIMETLKRLYNNNDKASIFHKSHSTQYYTTLHCTSLQYTTLLSSSTHNTVQHPNTPNKSQEWNKPLFFFSCIQILILLQRQKKVRDLEFVKEMYRKWDQVIRRARRNCDSIQQVKRVLTTILNCSCFVLNIRKYVSDKELQENQ